MRGSPPRSTSTSTCVSGAFELRKAGHPPAVWLHAGSGRWSVLNSDGPALGLLERRRLRGHRRTALSPGDGLLLFTDGLVETAQRDISLGMDKLAGLGERLVQSGFDGGAKLLIDSMEQTNDDRALVRGAPALERRRRFLTPVRDRGVPLWHDGPRPRWKRIEGRARM